MFIHRLKCKIRLIDTLWLHLLGKVWSSRQTLGFCSNGGSLWTQDPGNKAPVIVEGKKAIVEGKKAIVEGKKAIVEGKKAGRVKNEFFLVSVPLSQYKSRVHTSFPIENRLTRQGAQEWVKCGTLDQRL
jgi:hypothetical protein